MLYGLLAKDNYSTGHLKMSHSSSNVYHSAAWETFTNGIVEREGEVAKYKMA
jgi:hypothetical protein